MTEASKTNIQATLANAKGSGDIGEIYPELFLSTAAPVKNQTMVKSGMTAVHGFDPGLEPADGAQIVTTITDGTGQNHQLFKSGIASSEGGKLLIRSIWTWGCN